MSADEHPSQIPAARGFQFDGSGTGEVKSSVNLFNGDVNLRIPLVNLPGLDGLDVNVTAIYTSNVETSVRTWNLDAPTGILGLGWSMGFERIELVPGTGGSLLTARYTMTSGGGRNALVPLRPLTSPAPLPFALELYEFWRILYSPTAERWEITKEDGVTYVYGDANSGRSTVQWGVKWGNWVGSSNAPAGQSRYATAWNLSEIRDQWGNAVTFSYDAVTQAVAGGMAYTKASYLQKIAAPDGHAVSFAYRQKTRDAVQQIFEYQDPHKNAPDDLPNAYQDRYESRYLDALTVTAPGGQTLFVTRFGYTLLNASDPSDTTLHQNMWKRTLTSIVQETAGGQTQPGYAFTYYARGTQNPGALQSVTYPAGAVVTYGYRRTDVGTSSKFLTVSNPIPGSSARVWHGGESIIVTWYKAPSLRIAVYTWSGSWTAWSTDLRAAIQADSLVVITRPEWFAVRFVNTDTSSDDLHLFRRDATTFGQWNDTVKSARLSSTALKTQIAAGETFVTLYNPNFTAGAFTGWAWMWRSQTWEPFAVPTVPTVSRDIQMTAGNTFLIAGSYDRAAKQATFQTIYLDGVQWVRGTPWVGAFDAAMGEGSSLYALSAGATFFVIVAISRITGAGSGTIDYSVISYRWNERFDVSSASRHEFRTSTPFSGVQGLPVFLLQTADSFVGNNIHLFRYAGGRSDGWSRKSFTPIGSTTLPDEFRFAYTADAAVMAQKGSGGQNNALLTYDPNSHTWPARALPPDGVVPTASGSYLTINKRVWYQGPSGWAELTRAPLPGDVNQSTVANRAPFFIAYDDRSAGTIRVAITRNGTILSADTLRGPALSLDPGVAGPGTMLAGTTSLVGVPRGRTLDNALSLTLVRVLGDAVNESVADYPVVSLRIEDGYSSFLQTYRYDQGTASYNGAVAVAQYAKVTTIAATDGVQVPFGYTEWYFSNAVSRQGGVFYGTGWPYNHYGILNGVLLARIDFDDARREIARTTNYYRVRNRVRGIVDGTFSFLPGAYFRLMRRDEKLDGVTTVTQMSFDESTGLAVETQESLHDTDGLEVVKRTRTRYGTDLYGDLVARHFYTPIVETRTVTSTGGAADVLRAVKATVWKAWGSAWAPAAVYDWYGSGSGEFDPSWYAGTTSPSREDWVEVSRVVRRAATGQVHVERRYGQPSYNLLAAAGDVSVAQFGNADPATDAVGYQGFETYEDPGGGWTISGAATAVAHDAHTGSRCLQIDGPAALTRSVPFGGSRRSVIACWVRAGASFTAAGGSATWTVGTRSTTMAVTAGDWQYFSWSVDPGAASGAATLRVTYGGTPDGESWLRVDDVSLFPLDAAFGANVYSEGRRELTAMLGPNGQTTRFVVDSFGRRVVTAGPGEAPVSIRASFATRSTNTAAFPPGDPNRNVLVTFAGPGFDDPFRGTERKWTFAEPASWRLAGGALVFSGTNGNPLGSTAVRAALPSAGAALRVQVARTTGTATIGLGTPGKGALIVQYGGSGWLLARSDAGGLLQLGNNTAPFANDWLLIVIDDRILFYAGGNQVFSKELTGVATDAVVLGLTNPGSFTGLAFGTLPSLQITYGDGALKERQSLTVESGRSVLLAETVFDPVSRPAIVTLPSRITADGSRDIFTYFTGYVTNGGHTSALWEGAPMEGAVASLHPDAGGYPFRRTVYEPAKPTRTIMTGAPGADFAIRSGNPHVTTYSYAANGTGDFVVLPTAQYFVRRCTDPNGTVTESIFDKQGKELYRRSGPTTPGGSDFAVYSVSNDGMQRLSLSRQPLSLKSGPAQFTVRRTWDVLGRVVRTEDPDGGVTRIAWDDSGLQRITQDANGAAATPPYVTYQKFDSQRRLIERGTFAAAWDQAAMERHARFDPAWPPAGTWSERQEWDGDGTNPHLVGRRWKLRSRRDGDASTETVETFAYDRTGNVTADSLLCTAFDTTERTVSYSHDNLARVRTVAPGGGTPIVYGYDRLGRMVTVGTPGTANAFATYEYDADGMRKETLDPTSGAPIVTDLTRLPIGWPKTITSAVMREEITYTSGGADGAAYHDGTIASTRVEYPRHSASELQKYASDPLRRLVVTDSSSDGRTADRYDVNNNTTERAAGGTSRDWTYGPETNQLQQVRSGPAFTYDSSGNVISNSTRGLTLQYERARGLVSSIDVTPSSTNVSFLYSGKERVLKTVKTGAAVEKKLYIRGTHDRPIVELVDGTAGNRTQYIYGPRGLIAMRRGSGDLYLVKDHLGSTRVVCATTGVTVATYRYSPFGVTTSVGAPTETVNYLFTGQELDAETGLYNFRARLYDSAVGRFYSIDPLGQQPSPYVYVANAPLSMTDPTGTIFGFDDFLIGLIVGAVVGAAFGAVIGGVVYAIANKDNFSWRDFGLAVGVGALSGAISGAIGYAGPALFLSAAGTPLVTGVELVNAAVAPATASFETWLALNMGFRVAGSLVGKAVGDTISGPSEWWSWLLSAGGGVASSVYSTVKGWGVIPYEHGFKWGPVQPKQGSGPISDGSALRAPEGLPPILLGQPFYGAALQVDVPGAGAVAAIPPAPQWASFPWAGSAQRALVGGAAPASQAKFNPSAYPMMHSAATKGNGIWRQLA